MKKNIQKCDLREHKQIFVLSTIYFSEQKEKNSKEKETENKTHLLFVGCECGGGGVIRWGGA